MPNLADFAGVAPYDSELLGVFQPLLGWKGASGRRLQGRAWASRVVASARALASVSAAAGGAAPPLPVTGHPVLDAVARHVRTLHPDRNDLSNDEWRAALPPDVIRSAVNAAQSALPPHDPASGADLAFGGVLAAQYQATGTVVEKLLSSAPEALNNLLIAPASASAPYLADPLSRLPRIAEAVVSPIGLLNLFREYFFELDSFLGPPVGHVWLSPGSMLELVESTVRRRLVEKTIESSLEITTRSETSVETKEELSEAVRQENADDMKVAASASGGFNVGVAHGEASASFNLDQSRKTAAEQTHKRSRAQTDKKSTEIRQSFKTTFRTVSEVTDTTSKRYVLQNTTDQLVNYELRRKMRRVAVQLQHLGTHLCWQYYVDQPGQGIRTSSLVHHASLSDADMGLKPPEQPPRPDGNEDVYIATLGFHPVNYSAQMYWDEDWVEGRSDQKQIQWQWQATQPAKPGFQLESVSFVEMLPQGDLGGAPVLHAAPAATVIDAAKGTFEVRLPAINFHSARGIRVRLRYEPSQKTLDDSSAEFEKRQKDYQEQRARTYQEEFVKAVRERIKAAGSVRPRPFDDLREEERHAIFRRLVDALAPGGPGTADRHVAAEMVRQLFDIDAVLYFVAPDWWDPAARRRDTLNVASPPVQSPTGQTLTLGRGEMIDWGTHVSTAGEPYLVTEESNPAPLGASLGWVMQLDGDPMRNAFLNSAWAKVVVPMRPGRESEAITWLRDQAEQEVGLQTPYKAQPGDPQEWNGKPLEQVLDALITLLQKEHDQSSTVDGAIEALPGERVFAKGFDPLAGGVRFNLRPFEIFDQWLEILPTDQVVAVPYPPQE